MFISRKKSNITQQLHERVNSLLCIGEKKCKEKNHGQEHFNPNRADGIHSIGTATAIRGTAQRLSEVAKEKGAKTLEQCQEKNVLEVYMSRYKDASPHTVAREVSSLNKLFSTHYTPSDFGFTQKRTLEGIWHNRGDLPARSTSNLKRNEMALDFVRATGVRRCSFERGNICAKNFVWSKDGSEVIGFTTKEKNGLTRTSVIIPGERGWISDLVRNASSPTEVLISEPDRHAGTHRCRSEYCNTLMDCLARNRENDNGRDIYDGRKFDVFIDKNKYDRIMEHPRYGGDTVKGYDKEDLISASFAMGHSRICVLWSYLR